MWPFVQQIVSRIHRQEDTKCRSRTLGSAVSRSLIQSKFGTRINNSSRRKYTIFRQNSETGKLGIMVRHEETRSI